MFVCDGFIPSVFATAIYCTKIEMPFLASSVSHIALIIILPISSCLCMEYLSVLKPMSSRPSLLDRLN